MAPGDPGARLEGRPHSSEAIALAATSSIGSGVLEPARPASSPPVGSRAVPVPTGCVALLGPLALVVLWRRGDPRRRSDAENRESEMFNVETGGTGGGCGRVADWGVPLRRRPEREEERVWCFCAAAEGKRCQPCDIRF